MKKILLLLFAVSIIKLNAATTVVQSSNFTFTPNSITINSGDIVAFSNAGGFHFVEWLTSPATLPANSMTLTATPQNYTLTVAGIYTYRCGVHNSMLGTITVQSSALPIKLKMFDLALIDDGYKLNWTTSTETNVAHFAVERSINDLSFIKIGKINAKGNSKEENKYAFDDKNLPAKSDIIYYRLKTIDSDNSFDYSPIIAVKTVSRVGLSIYPNPATNVLIFEGGGHDFHHTINEITVFNTVGDKIIGPKTMNNKHGESIYDLDVMGLISGKYIAIIDNKIGVKKSIKFVVNR
jgi:plastocyanin